MRVLLQNMIRDSDAGRVRMIVQFGEESPKEFLGDFDGTNAKYKTCNVDQELFMRLSDLAMKRFCNCVIYQLELMGLIGAFLSGQPIPPFPIELGTTGFGLKRPSKTRILWNRIRRPFLSKWYWWKHRRIREENLRKCQTVSNQKV